MDFTWFQCSLKRLINHAIVKFKSVVLYIHLNKVALLWRFSSWTSQIDPRLRIIFFYTSSYTSRLPSNFYLRNLFCSHTIFVYFCEIFQSQPSIYLLIEEQSLEIWICCYESSSKFLFGIAYDSCINGIISIDAPLIFSESPVILPQYWTNFMK